MATSQRMERKMKLGCALLLILFMTPFVLLFTLSALFAESRVGKTRAQRLEEGLTRHIYSLLAAGAAAIA